MDTNNLLMDTNNLLFVPGGSVPPSTSIRTSNALTVTEGDTSSIASSRLSNTDSKLVEKCRAITAWKKQRAWFRYLIIILQKTTVAASVLFALSNALGFWATSPILPIAIVAMGVLGGFNLFFFIVFECAETVTEWNEASASGRRKVWIVVKFVSELLLTAFSLVMVGSEVHGLIRGVDTLLDFIVHELMLLLETGNWFALIFEIAVLEGLETLIVLYEYWPDEKNLLKGLLFYLCCCWVFRSRSDSVLGHRVSVFSEPTKPASSAV